jgi:hypothetical protein
MLAVAAGDGPRGEDLWCVRAGGHHEPGVGAWGQDFGLDDDAMGLLPAVSLLKRLPDQAPQSMPLPARCRYASATGGLPAQ